MIEWTRRTALPVLGVILCVFITPIEWIHRRVPPAFGVIRTEWRGH